MRQDIINDFLPTHLPNFFDEVGIPKIRQIDLFSVLGGRNLEKPHLIADGCHPTYDGQQVIANAVLEKF